MIKDILTATGLPFAETMFTRAVPAKTYAVYMDYVETDGSDLENLLYWHNGTIELYEPKADPKAEADLEAQLNKRGLKWTKQARYWIPEAQRFQVVYEFTWYIKT